MGIDYNTFVGPYIEVYNPEKDTTVKFPTCRNVNCVQHGTELSGIYCSRCGKLIDLATRISKERIEFDWYTSLGEKNICGITVENKSDNEYFISNKNDIAGIYMDGRYPSVEEIEIKNIQIQIKNFKKMASVEIKKLEKIFGKDNVKIKWGVLVWCS